MYWIYVILIMGCIFMLSKNVSQNLFKPYTMAQRKKYDETRKYEGSHGFDIEKFQSKASRRMPIIDMNEEAEEQLKHNIARLGLSTTVKEIRQLQMLYTSILLILGGVVFLVGVKLIGMIIMSVGLLAWRYPINKIEKEIKERNEAVNRELPGMYNILYYVYKRSPNANLTQKIQSYVSNTGPLFYKEMQLFIDDARNGEQYALRQFKKRIPIPIVMRFCDIMETRLVGYDNLSVMENFKNEMEAKKSEAEEKILKDLERDLTMISWGGVGASLGITMVLYFGVQLFSTI